MLRRAIIIVSLASFPPRGGCRAGQQIHANPDQGAENWAPLSKRREGAAADGGVLLSAPKRGPLANCGRLRAPPVPPPAAKLRALAARPSSPPTSDSCGSREFTRRWGLGGGSPNRALVARARLL